MAIRIASVTDVARLHDIRLSVRENQLSHPDRVRHQDYVTLLETTGGGWVFEQDGAIVAFGIADAGSRSIWALFVAPGFEGRGIGRALLETMTAWLFARGSRRVWLTTAPGTRAERLYRAAGWRDLGLEPNGELRFELVRGHGNGERP